MGVEKRRAWVVALFLFLAATTPSLAQSPSPSREQWRLQAKKLKEEGARALEQRNFAQALDRFQAAYRAFPSPNLRYNMGLALAELGRPLEALEAFEDFLTNAKDVPAEALAHARVQVTELDKQVGHLAMTCNRSGATVSVDEKLVGDTPLPGAVRVAAGRHRVTIAQDGFRPFQFRVDAGKGNTFNVDAVLVPVDQSLPQDARRRHLAPAIVAGATALVAAIGAGLRINAQVQYGNLEGSCSPSCDRSQWSGLPAREYAGDALLGVAAALAVVDIALWVVDLRKPRTSRKADATAR